MGAIYAAFPERPYGDGCVLGLVIPHVGKGLKSAGVVDQPHPQIRYLIRSRRRSFTYRYEYLAEMMMNAVAHGVGFTCQFTPPSVLGSGQQSFAIPSIALITYRSRMEQGLTFARRVDQMPSQAVLVEIDRRVDFAEMERVLMEEGIKKFADPQKALLAQIAAKRVELSAAPS